MRVRATRILDMDAVGIQSFQLVKVHIPALSDHAAERMSQAMFGIN
jgi:hypothetical protein